jgi:hypothetical protein
MDGFRLDPLDPDAMMFFSKGWLLIPSAAHPGAYCHFLLALAQVGPHNTAALAGGCAAAT